MTIITVCRIIHTAVSLCGCLVLLVVLHSKEITFRAGAECLNGTVTHSFVWPTETEMCVLKLMEHILQAKTER